MTPTEQKPPRIAELLAELDGRLDGELADDVLAIALYFAVGAAKDMGMSKHELLALLETVWNVQTLLSEKTQ